MSFQGLRTGDSAGPGGHFCPYCHDYEVRGRTVRSAWRQALLIRQSSDDVVFIPHLIDLEYHDRERLDDHGVRIVDCEVTRIVSAAVNNQHQVAADAEKVCDVGAACSSQAASETSNSSRWAAIVGH